MIKEILHQKITRQRLKEILIRQNNIQLQRIIIHQRITLHRREQILIILQKIIRRREQIILHEQLRRQETVEILPEVPAIMGAGGNLK